MWVPPELYPGDKAYAYSIAQFNAIDRLVSNNAGVAVLARSAAEVRSAAAAGKIAFLIGVEGAHGLGDVPDERLIARLHEFYERGARYMTLTWSNSNRLGGSSGDVGKSRGLTPLGLRVVKVMNDLGMMVDVSHVSDATFFDAVKASNETRDRLAFVGARALRPPQKHDRRHAAGRARQRRRGMREFRSGVPRRRAGTRSWAVLQKSLGPEMGNLVKEHPGRPEEP